MTDPVRRDLDDLLACLRRRLGLFDAARGQVAYTAEHAALDGAIAAELERLRALDRRFAAAVPPR